MLSKDICLPCCLCCVSRFMKEKRKREKALKISISFDFYSLSYLFCVWPFFLGDQAHLAVLRSRQPASKRKQQQISFCTNPRLWVGGNQPIMVSRHVEAISRSVQCVQVVCWTPQLQFWSLHRLSNLGDFKAPVEVKLVFITFELVLAV